VYLPLAERRSGLLMPRPTLSGLSGFGFEQPVFLTLGRSYDMTFTPGWFTGSTEEHTVSYSPMEVRREPSFGGIKGPRLSTEFRYAPSPDTNGRATLGFIYDLKPIREPLYGSFFRGGSLPPGDYVDEARGLRGEASWQHMQRLGEGLYNRVDASFVSDGFYTRDLTADILAREAGYLRSTGTLYHRGEDTYVGLEVGLRQDLRWGYNFFRDNRYPEAISPERVLIPGPNTFQRLPVVTLALPERRLGAGPLVGGLQVQFSRLSPLLTLMGDEGDDGRFMPIIPLPDGSLPTGADPTQHNGVFDARDREARDRLDLFPRLSASFSLGRFLRATPYAAIRQDLWLGEVSGRVWQRGYPLAGLTLDAELSRTYAPRTGLLRHTLMPSVELRAVPFVWGGVPRPGASPDDAPQLYDEIDAAVPLSPEGQSQGFLHAVAQVSQTLFTGEGAQSREVVRLTVGQGMDLSAGEGVPVLRDSFARLGASWRVLNAAAQVRFDPNKLEITQLSADLSLDNGRGSALYGRYEDLLVVGSDRLRRGIDTLVGPLADDPRRAQLLTAGMRFTLGIGLGLRYEAVVQPLAKEFSPLAQQVLGVSYGPACDCWRVEGVATLRRGQSQPDFGMNVSVAGFGSFGAGG
jgi:LPS-assembly protein